MASPFCQHEHDEFVRGAYTGHVIGCSEPAVPGERFCLDHGTPCASCRELFERTEDETECADCRAETARLLALPGRCSLCGLRNYRSDDAPCGCCVPARREADCAETVAAAPTPEALAHAAALGSLVTNVALVSGALWGIA